MSAQLSAYGQLGRDPRPVDTSSGKAMTVATGKPASWMIDGNQSHEPLLASTSGKRLALGALHRAWLAIRVPKTMHLVLRPAAINGRLKRRFSIAERGLQYEPENPLRNARY